MSERADGQYTIEHEARDVSEVVFEENQEAKAEYEIKLKLDTTSRINFASAQNDVPVIKSLSITNSGERTLEDIDVSLSASPAVIRPKTWKIDRLSAEQSLNLNDLSTPLDLQHLSGLNETELGSLSLTITHADGHLLFENRRLELLARDQWGGLGDMDRLLAAFGHCQVVFWA